MPYQSLRLASSCTRFVISEYYFDKEFLTGITIFCLNETLDKVQNDAHTIIKFIAERGYKVNVRIETIQNTVTEQWQKRYIIRLCCVGLDDNTLFKKLRARKIYILHFAGSCILWSEWPLGWCPWCGILGFLAHLVEDEEEGVLYICSHRSIKRSSTEMLNHSKYMTESFVVSKIIPIFVADKQ